jgi:hypothetical protein
LKSEEALKKAEDGMITALQGPQEADNVFPEADLMGKKTPA